MTIRSSVYILGSAHQIFHGSNRCGSFLRTLVTLTGRFYSFVFPAQALFRGFKTGGAVHEIFLISVVGFSELS